MSWLDKKAFEEKYEGLISQQEQIITFAKSENRGLNAEENTNFDKIGEEAEKLAETFNKSQALAKTKETFSKNLISMEKEIVDGKGDKQAKFAKLNKDLATFALSAGTSTSGSELVQQLIPNFWDVSLRGVFPIFQCGFRERDVPVSGTYKIPTWDGTSNTGALVAEKSAMTPADPTTGSGTCQDYRYTAGTPITRQELVSGSADIMQYLQDDFADQILNQFNEQATVTGTGTGSPTSLVAASSLGNTADATAAITYNELIDTKYAMNAAYHTGAFWMMHPKTWGAITKLVNGQSVVNSESITTGLNKTLDGDKVILNSSMANLASGVSSKVVLYCQPRYGLIKRVTSISSLVIDNCTLAKNDEILYILNNYLGFCFTKSAACVHLKLAAS